jgi:hypothetical protein
VYDHPAHNPKVTGSKSCPRHQRTPWSATTAGQGFSRSRTRFYRICHQFVIAIRPQNFRILVMAPSLAKSRRSGCSGRSMARHLPWRSIVADLRLAGSACGTRCVTHRRLHAIRRRRARRQPTRRQERPHPWFPPIDCKTYRLTSCPSMPRVARTGSRGAKRRTRRREVRDRAAGAYRPGRT